MFKRACVSAEFRAFAANESSPVTHWLRALARLAHEECGGLGVGAIGMCFTGNFALTMLDIWWDEWVQDYRVSRVAPCPCRQ